MSASRSVLFAALLLGAGAIEAVVHGQMSGPPAGGPDWTSIGPPTGTVANFLGSWDLSWDGPIDARCPCRGTLTIEMKQTADGTGLAGTWQMKGTTALLQGAVAVNQNVWVGRFAQPDDASDFPMRGNFRLEARDANTLTGSYQPQGTAIPFRWSASR